MAAGAVNFGLLPRFPAAATFTGLHIHNGAAGVAGPVTIPTDLGSANVTSDTGVATIQLNRQPGTPGVNGSGVLVTLNFTAIGRGITVVNIPGLTVRNSQGQALPAGNPQLQIAVR